MKRAPQLIVVWIWIASLSCAPWSRLEFPDAPIARQSNWIWYDVDHNGHADFALRVAGERIDAVAYDDNEDGQIDRVFPFKDYANESVPHVIVMLDSIPYEAVAERYARGDFRFCDPPQKVIAPFPSLTEICYTSLLHCPKLPGMIDQYYDPTTGERHNDLWRRTLGWKEPWEKPLAYRSAFYEEGLAYLDPEPWFAAEMERIRNTVHHSSAHVILVYTTSASAMLSNYGQYGLDRVLDQVQRLCVDLLYEHHGAIKITLLADHGHNLMRSKNVSVESALTAAGFHPTDRIAHEDDVVLEVNGLVTYAAVHTTQPARVAQAIAQMREVELAAYRENESIIVRTSGGRAVIKQRDGQFEYAPIDCDVFGYGHVTASDSQWFSSTLDHEFPDAPRRLWDAFHNTAMRTPTVLFTLRDGYCCGDPAFERFIKMSSTHGGLNQINSATFVMSMTGNATHPNRTCDVLCELEPGVLQSEHR